jgi:uncharacterized protein YrrD
MFSHDNAVLVGFTLNKRGWLSGPRKEILPWSGVHALGPDAVMVASGDALVARDAAPDAETFAAGDAEDVVGGRVITDSGRELGVVTDLVLAVDEQARVVGYEIGGEAVERGPGADRRYIPLPETFAVSSSALLVPDSVSGFIRDDLAGFGSAVDDFRAPLEGSP